MTAQPQRRAAVSNTRWVVHHMISIRIAIASLLAAGAVLAGGALAQRAAGESVSHTVVVAGLMPCCDDVVVR
ncbi:MAG TPA: hypothetical protein VMA73_06980 [Streptosporangiaceae bacterium]|nr:hypothetical protein [Streptosporangiaceae bacterium]